MSNIGGPISNSRPGVIHKTGTYVPPWMIRTVPIKGAAAFSFTAAPPKSDFTNRLVTWCIIRHESLAGLARARNHWAIRLVSGPISQQLIPYSCYMARFKAFELGCVPVVNIGTSPTTSPTTNLPYNPTRSRFANGECLPVLAEKCR